METNEQSNDTFVPPLPSKKQSSFFGELIRFALIAVIIVVPLRLYIAQPFIVSGASMSPTFETGEYLIIDELSYHLREPRRGDVIVFRFPQNPSKFFIKRVIGLPNETVRTENGAVVVQNEKHPDGLTLYEPYLVTETAPFRSVTLGPTEYFVLGDNRPASSDSRIWGPLASDLVIGRAFVRLLPVARADVLPGGYQIEEVAQ
ncbi:signal peptidase I [Candidatus Wolfebacteria bacterium]|nr:signal peptidase I [Candidatus Wolfebacteria bacterium]